MAFVVVHIDGELNASDRLCLRYLFSVNDRKRESKEKVVLHNFDGLYGPVHPVV